MSAVYQLPPAQGPAPEQDELDLREVWLAIRRRWRLVVGCVVLALGTGFWATRMMSPQYQATLSLRIDEGESGIPSLDLLQNLSGKGEVNTELEILRSRSLAEEVIDSLGLRVVPTHPTRVPRRELFAQVHVGDSAFPTAYRLERQPDGQFAAFIKDSSREVGRAAPGRPLALLGAEVVLAPAAAVHEKLEFHVLSRNRAVESFRRALSVTRPSRDASILVARLRHTDPEVVRDAANLLGDRFIQGRVEVRKTGARSTVSFLRAQLDTLSGQLRRAEDSVRAFRETAKVISLEAEAGSQVHRLAELQAQRTGLDAERAALEHLLQEVGGSGEGGTYRRLMAFPTLLKATPATNLLSTLTSLEEQRATLLLRRTSKDPDVQALDRTIADLERQVQSVVTTYLGGLKAQVAALDTHLASFSEGLAKIPAKEVQYARLQRHTSVLSEMYTLLQTRLKEAEIARAVEDPSVQVVDAAYLPEEPFAPRLSFNLLLALLGGLALGIAAALGREWADTTVHTQEEVQQITGVPVLGLIPHIREAAATPRLRRASTLAAQAESRSKALVAGRDPRGVVSEAYRALRTSLAFVRTDSPPRIVVFTSPAPGDGKTTSIANLAASLAQQGMRTLVIDADMRRGQLHNVFGAHAVPGLSDVLAGRKDVADVIQPVDLGEGGQVDVIGHGTVPPNPAELVASERAGQLLDRLRATYDIVLIDAPPVNLVTDAAVIGAKADGVILVARAGKTHRKALAFGAEQLRRVRATVFGAVLNDYNVKRDGSYGAYGYGYGYGDGEAHAVGKEA